MNKFYYDMLRWNAEQTSKLSAIKDGGFDFTTEEITGGTRLGIKRSSDTEYTYIDILNGTNGIDGTDGSFDQLGYYSAVAPPSPLLPVFVDETSDSSARLQALIDYVGTAGGGTIVLPDCKIKANVVFNKDNIQMVGVSKGRTVITPNDASIHCLQFGDGSRRVRNITMRDFELHGHYATNTGDGIHINGLYEAYFENILVKWFGRDNIHITSPAIYETSKITFSKVECREAFRHCLHIEYGLTWTTAIYFLGYTSYLAASATESKSVYLKNASPVMVLSYIDTRTEHGIVIEDGGGIEGYGVDVDNGLDLENPNAVVIETNILSTTYFAPFKGVYLTGNCAIRYGDGVEMPYGGSQHLPYKSKVYGLNIFGYAKFIGPKNVNVEDANIASISYNESAEYFVINNPDGRVQVVPGNGMLEVRKDGVSPKLVLRNGANAGNLLLSGDKLSIYADNNGTVEMLGTTIVKRDVADATSAFTVNNANATSTGNIANFQFGGVSKARIDKDGNFYTGGNIYGTIRNSTSSANATIDPTTTGTIISRNQADANSALTVNQVNASSTGAIQEWQAEGLRKAYVETTGALRTVEIKQISSSTNGYIHMGGSNDPVTISRERADAYATLVVDNKSATSTGYIVDFRSEGTSVARIMKNGEMYLGGSLRITSNTGIRNNANSNYGLMYVGGTSSSSVISRNMADAYSALVVNNAHASSTGNIQEWQAAGTRKAYIDRSGNLHLPAGAQILYDA